MYLQIISRCDNSLRTVKGGSMYCHRGDGNGVCFHISSIPYYLLPLLYSPSPSTSFMELSPGWTATTSTSPTVAERSEVSRK